MNTSQSSCYYCYCTGGRHAPSCPDGKGEEKKKIWHNGFQDGNNGNKKHSRTGTYLLGFNIGVGARFLAKK